MADEGWKKPIFIVKWMTKYFDSLMEKLDAIQNMFGTSGDADVSSADIRLGKKAYNGTTLVTGTMPENVAVAETLTAGEAYVIPQGYHDGTGKVTADSLASQTDGTATAAQILSGKTAYVDGVKVTGSMTNNGAKTASLAAGASYTIPAGYHDGTGKVTANSLASQTDGTATAAQILSGKTAYVDGKKVTGSMGNKAGTTVEASAVTQDDTNTYFNVPAGFYDANSKVYTPNSNLEQEFEYYEFDAKQGYTLTLAKGKKPRILVAQSMNASGALSRASFYITSWCEAIYGKDSICFYDQAAGSCGLYALPVTSGTYNIRSIDDNGAVVFGPFPNYPIVKVWVMY